ncbi:hypothetical protein ABPG72_016099 [Tetrahymena utriculariae]
MNQQSTSKYQQKENSKPKPNFFQLIAKSFRTYYLNKCYPLIKLYQRSFCFSLVLLALKSVLLLLTNVDQDIKNYLDQNQITSISSKIDLINYNLNKSYNQSILQLILIINIYIIFILSIEFLISLSNTFKSSAQIFSITEDEESEISAINSMNENQKESQFFNRSLTTYKILSLLLQCYPYVIYVPSLSISLQNFNTLSYINLPITIIINLFVSFHEFNYEFSQKRDYLARRNYWSQMIVFVFDTTTICVLQLQQSSSVLLGFNICHFFIIAVYEYYQVPIIQNKIQYFSLGLSVMQFLITAQILFNKQLSINVDSFLSFLFIGPLSWKIGYSLARYRINNIVTKNHQVFKNIYQQMSLAKLKQNNILHSNETNINESNILQFEIYIRFLLDNLKCFFDDFSNSQYGIILQDIIELHKENCFGQQNITASSCYCRIVNQQEEIDRNEFLDKKWRFQFLNSYITDLFVNQISRLQRSPLQVIEREQTTNRFLHNNEQANILKFQFISYLVEIQRNETLAFKELLSLGKDICSEIDENHDTKDAFYNKESKSKTKQTFQLSLREQLIVRYLYQRSLYSFKFQQQIHLRNKLHERYMLFSIMSFDEKIHIAQQMLRNCIEEKSILIKNLSQSEINIEQIFQDGVNLRKQRRELMKMLKQLINLNSYCSQLEEMCQFFDSTINFDLSLLKVLRKKKERESESSNSKRKQIFFTIQKFYSPDSTVAFVTLMGKVGNIVKVSNNFSQIIPNFTTKENSVVGSSINCMIPPQLQAAHDAILQDFGKQEVMQTALKDLPLIIGVDKNGFSVPYSLKLQTYHDIINYELGICAWIKRLNLNYQNKFQDVQFINANLNQNASIINTSQQFFEQVIHTHFHQRDMHSISLFSMIPALEGIIKDYQQMQEIENHSKLVGEIYETLLVEVKPDLKQANWMKQPHRETLIRQISKLQLHWIQMEVSVVKNKYMNILQIQIKSMRNLHSSIQNLTNSFDNNNNLSLKIEGIKSLCIQLLSICEWTQEEISSQLVDLALEDCSPINRQISQKQNQVSIDISPSNRKGSLNSSSLNQYKKYSSIQFGNRRKFSNQDKEYELIHLKEVKQVDEEEEHLEKINNMSINKISFPSLPQIPLTNRENYSLVDLLRTDRGLSMGEEVNLMNASNNNFMQKKYPSFQEEKNDNFQSSVNISYNQEIKQVNKLNLNNISIENLTFSPNNNDYFPLYQLSHSITQNQVSTSKNILYPHKQSINSFPYGSNLINNSTSIEKNTSKEDNSPAIIKAKIFNPIKRNKQGQQVDNESSVNSNKTTHDGLKREIISKIKSQKKIRILIGINVIGIMTIIGLYLMNIFNFTSLEYLLSNEKTAFHLIDWCSQLRLSYAYSLSDMYLLVMMQLKIVQFTSIKQFLEYKEFALQRLNSSYQTYKQLMEQFTNQDKNQVDVFNTILNTHLNNSFYSTPTSFYNITISLNYALITQLGNIAMYASLNDKTQVHQINANQNYEGIINHLTTLQDQNNYQYDRVLNNIYNDQMNQMIYVLVTTFIISLSVLPTFSFIQIKRQEILKLLSTFSPDKLKCMMVNLLKSRQRINEMLLSQRNSNAPQSKNNQTSFNETTNKKKKGQQSTAISQNDDDLFFLAQTQIQKKRNISSIKPLNKLNIKLLIWVLVFFVVMQVYSVLILYFVSSFKKNSISNRTIMNALTETKSQISAQFAMNQVMNIVILAPQLVPPPYDLYFGRAYYLSNQTNQVLTDLYSAQQEVHSFDRYQQDQFDSFLRPVFEKDACNTLENFSQFTEGTNFNYSQCQTVQDGQLNYGLINAVKQMTILLTQQVDLIKINNKKLYQYQLNIFQQQNNFYILDLFRNQIDSTINSSLAFMNHVNDINNLASKSVRCKYFNSQIEMLFEAIFKNYKTENITNVSYLMFIADIIQNPTKCIVQSLRYSNANKRNWLLNQQLFQIVLFAKQKLQNFKNPSESQTLQESDKIFYENIIFDKKISECFKLLRYCMEEKKIALQQIGQDEINLQQIHNYFMQIRKKRNHLENQLKELSERHYNNQVLIYLVDIFESTLQFNQKLGRQLSNLRKKCYNLPKHEEQFDQSACTVFISLTQKIGEIKMVSNNFKRVIPASSNSEVIGKNINFMIPYEIAQLHDRILQKYIENYTPSNCTNILNLQIAIDNEGWGIPYTIKIQNFQQEMKDFGVCAVLKQIVDSNIYLSVNLSNQCQVLAMQKRFYETFLSKSLNESNARKMNIDILIPAFKQIFLQNQDNRTYKQFQTIFVKPRNQQEFSMLRTLNQKTSNLNNLLELNLLLVNGEYQIIDNQYISIAQIKITNVSYLEDRVSKTYEILQLNQVIQNSSDLIQNSKLESKCSQEEFFELNQQKNQELQLILLSANSTPAQRQYLNQKKLKNTYYEKQEITNQSNFMDMLNQYQNRENQNENLDQIDIGITTDVNKNTNNFIMSPINSFRNQSSNQLLVQKQEMTQIQQVPKQLFSKQQEMEKSPIRQEIFLQKKFNSIKNISQYGTGTDTFIKILSDKEIEQSTNNLKQMTDLTMMKQANQNIDMSIQSDDNKQEVDESHFKRTSTKKIQEGQIAQSVHSQQSTRSIKRDQLINQIQKKQNLTGLIILKLFGICSLILFLFLNILNFYQLEQEIIFQRDDYINIDWGSTLRETFSQVIGDQNLLGLLQVPYFKNPPQLQAQILKNILDYQKQRYKIMQTLILRFEQTDKSKTNLYEFVLDTKQKLYFGYSVARNVTFDSYFGYVQIASLGYLYQVSHQIDNQGQNQLQLIVNYLETVNSLDSFQADIQNKLTQELDKIVNQAQLSLIIIVCVSSAVSLNGLYKLNDYLTSITVIRSPLILTKLLNYQDYFSAYLIRAQSLLIDLNEQQNSFYNLVEKQYKETRFEQSQFDDYVYRVLQSDACNAVKENTNLLIEQGFDYNQCISTQNGVLNTGLVKSVQFLLETYKSRLPAYLIQDPKLFMKQILQQENDFNTFNSYYFRIYFNYIIETIYRKVNILSDDYYQYILKINHVLISISLVSFVFTFYLVYHKFFVIQIEQLTETKRILDIIDIHVIEDNQYIMNYFKKFK